MRLSTVPKKLTWSIVAPVALLAAALVAVAWLDVSTGGEATPKPPMGDIGTPVRFAYVRPTPPPPGLKPTPSPTVKKTPTLSKVPQGTPAERDARRRADLLVLLDATKKLRDKDGQFPNTNNNVQSVCVYHDTDALCKLEQFLGGPPPEDPFGTQHGYWYSGAPDGQSMKLLANLEGDVPPDPRCETPDAGIQALPNIICVTLP
jgi:hypothetical protein